MFQEGSDVSCPENMCGIKLCESELCADSQDLPSKQWNAHDKGFVRGTKASDERGLSEASPEFS